MRKNYLARISFLLKCLSVLLILSVYGNTVFASGGVTLSAASPALTSQTYVAGSTSNVLFGFGLTKASGTPDNVTVFRINLDKDPAILFPSSSGITIKKNGATIASSTYAFSGSGPWFIDITLGTAQTVTASVDQYLVLADVNATVVGTDGPVIASITNADITFSAGGNTASGGTITAPAVNFSDLTATLSTNNAGLSSTLVAGSTNTPVFGFSTVSNGSQTINSVVIKITTTASSLSSILTNIKLKDDGTNSSYSGGGTSSSAGAPVSSGSGPFVYTITFTPSVSLPVSPATSEFLYVVADIPAGAPATTGIQIDVTTVAVNQGSVSSLTGFTRNFDINALSASLTKNNGSLAATIGAGSTNDPLFSFSAVSNGSQTINNVVIKITTTASTLSSILTNIKLKDDGTNSTYSGGGTSYAAGAPATSGSGPFVYTITFTPSAALPISPVSKFFYIVADVPGGASATPGIQLDVTTVGLNQGSVSSLTGYSRTFDITLAQTSTITQNFQGQSSIDFSEYSSPNTASSGLTTSNSQRIFAIDITDSDTDTQGTTITSLTLQFTGTAVTNLNAIALFDAGSSAEIAGSEKPVATSINGSNQIVFSGINIPVSDGSIGTPSVKTIDIRVTFNDAVADGDQIPISVATATASATGSGLAAIGSVATGSGKNLINVVGTKLIFLDPAASPPYSEFRGPFNVTPSPNPGSSFSGKVAAVDANNNIDTDNTGTTSLSATGGPGSLAGGSGQALINGTKTFSSLSINAAGTYDLNASQGGLTSANSGNSTSIVVNVTSLGVNITAANLSNICYDGNFQALSNIVIQESDRGDFSTGTAQTFSLELPSGFIFDNTVTTAPTVTGNEISAPSSLTYSTDQTIVRFSYSISGNTNTTLDKISIGGLKVRYIGSTPESGNITRIGGSATQAGNADTNGKNHGTLSTNPNPSGAVVDFTVSAISGDPAVAPSKMNYSVTDKAVLLNGSLNTVAASGTFSGNGVAFTSPLGYTFNPFSAGQGTTPISFTTRETTGQQCLITVSKNFSVSSANVIQNLANSYCKNSTPATGLAITASQMNTDFPPDLIAIPPVTYSFVDIVYTQSYTPITISFFGFPITFYIPNWASIPPANNVFNPGDNVTYGTRLVDVHDPGAIDFSYRVQRSTDNAILQSGAVQRVVVHDPPVVTFSLTPTSYCADDAPIDLIGNPLQTSIQTDDFFTATPGGSVAFTGGSWKFNPANAGVTSIPKSISIKYTFTDTGTGCKDASTPVVVTVNPRPAAVSGASILPGTTIRACQFGILGSFMATPIAGTYQWYSNSSLTSFIQVGDVFNPNGAVLTGTSSTTNFYVTQKINGCESLAGLQVTAIVDPQPLAPGSDFTKPYCLNSTIPANEFSVTGSNITWYSSLDGFSTPISPISNPGNPTPSELGISTLAVNTYSFKVTQTSSSPQNCPSPSINVNVVIQDLPALSITSSELLLSKICISGNIITFKTSRPNGVDTNTGTWSGSASGFLVNTVAGSAQLKPASLSPGNSYTLKYDFTDQGSSCTNSTQISLTTLPTITPSLSVGPSCNGFYTDITNNSTIVPFASLSTIDSIAWDFGDQSSLPKRKYDKPIPDGFSIVTKGTFKDPSHIYKQIALFTVNYTMTTSDGCTVTGTQQISNHEVPQATFAWSNPCYDNTSGTSNVQFIAANLNNNMVPGDIQSYLWDFAATSPTPVLTYSSPSSGKTPVTNYTNYGRDSVQLILVSVNNCRDTVQKPVFIVPSFPALSEGNSYTQNFNSATDGWIDGGTNSSWQLGVPNASIINRDSSATGNGKAWVTNLTGNNNPNEQSWVLSPCFDFSQTQKPVISLDIWSDTPKRLDGAVLEYNLNGNIEKDASWSVVGQVGLGVEWYDQTGISSKPGNQSAADGDTGWTGDASGGKYKGWVHSIFKLDNLVGKSNVVFRIAFASGSGSHEGFAFDNIFIGERSRSVLVENFTNTSTAANARTQNEAFNAFQSASTEVIKVQYHTAFPGYDTLNKANAAMNGARTAFYGITTAPSLRIDGNYGTDPNWFAQLYDQEVLSPSPVRIDIITAKEGQVVKIKASVTNTTGNTLSSSDIHLFVVVVEKSITTSPWLGNDGDLQFKYVARQMLPSPSGIPLPDQLLAGQTYDAQELTWQNNDLIAANNSGIVVFVQNIRDNKQVYQAKFFDNGGIEPSLVTGFEPVIAEQVKLFPNPADQSLTIQLPSSVIENTPMKIFDVNGREVYHTVLGEGEKSKIVNTAGFAGGVYLLQINAGDIVRKKVMVLHQQ